MATQRSSLGQRVCVGSFPNKATIRPFGLSKPLPTSVSVSPAAAVSGTSASSVDARRLALTGGDVVVVVDDVVDAPTGAFEVVVGAVVWTGWTAFPRRFGPCDVADTVTQMSDAAAATRTRTPTRNATRRGRDNLDSPFGAGAGEAHSALSGTRHRSPRTLRSGEVAPDSGLCGSIRTL
jgi:hypothetical protein